MNENEIQVWNYESSEIRTVQVNGEPWFVGKDVTAVLGYANSSKALSDHVDAEDKLNNESLSSLGQRGGWLINESGLYSLILSSNLPNAKQFKRWVTSEVLPSIRKTGSYSVQQPNAFENLSPQLQVLIQMETRQKQIEARQTEQATALAGLEQKLQNTCEVIALDKTAWRKDSEHLINKIARATGDGYGGIWLPLGERQRGRQPPDAQLRAL